MLFLYVIINYINSAIGKMRRIITLATFIFAGISLLSASVRSERLLEKGWRFTRDDNPEFAARDFNDAAWQTVTVPHDWAIYGPFSWDNDRQNVAITQDGQKEAMEHAGRTGGLPFVGTGWYRTELEIPEFSDGKRATLVFDGAMSRARVYVNGKEAGYWPYGYRARWTLQECASCGYGRSSYTGMGNIYNHS